MKTKIFTTILMLVGFSVFAAESYACSPLPPVAVLSAEPENAEIDETIVLDGNDSYDPDYPYIITKYEWDFTSNGTYDYNETSTDYGDGAFDGNTTYAYDSVGVYTVTLRVTDSNSNPNTDTDICTVYVLGAHNITQDTWYSTIQAALDEANNGDTIEVNEGTYYESIDFGGVACTLISTDANDWDVIAATIIDSQATRGAPNSVVSFCSGEGSDSVITGFTITNGYGRLDPNYGYYAGGGIFCGNSSSPTISNCIITGNMNDSVNSDVDGGGIACYDGSDAQIINCIIRDNNSYFSGGASFWSSNPTIKNCIVVDNVADAGGGLFCTDSNANIINCTIAHNTCTYDGGGLTNYDNADPNVTNCIFWANSAPYGGQIYNYSGCTSTISYCDIQGCGGSGTSWDGDLGIDGGGNIDSDPLFVDPNSDFHLQFESPCINAGDPDGDYNGQTDIDGQERAYATSVDIGADEIYYERFYVSTDGNDDNSGLSWAAAFRTIQKALDDAIGGLTVEVNEGTYYESIDFGGVTCTLTSNSPNYGLAVAGTIIDGNYSDANVVTFDSGEDSNCTMAGFTIRGGARGIYCVGASAVINRCVVTGNGDGSDNGSGIYISDGAPDISNCFIVENNGSYGGGIYDYNSTSTITGCVIAKNSSDANGGGLYIDNSSTEVINCSFSKNTAEDGGGIYSEDSSAVITNSILWGNSATGSGDEVYVSGSGPNFSYCDVNGCGGSGGGWDSSFGTDGGGNIDSDPCFTDINDPNGPDDICLTEDDGLRIQIDRLGIIDSPCIDSADGDSGPGSDILGFGRVDVEEVNDTGTGDPNYVDMGAYENQGRYLSYGMEVNSVTQDAGTVTVVTTGATYVLDSDGMDMYRRIDPNTNDIDDSNDGKGRKVATLDFSSPIGALSITAWSENFAVVDSDLVTFNFQPDSFFFITAKDNVSVTHTNLIENAPWNAPLDVDDRDLDRMWTDGYGGSLLASPSDDTNGTVIAEDPNYTTVSLAAGDQTAHMVFPPKTFDFEGLYGTDARPFVHFIGPTNMDAFINNTNNYRQDLVDDGFGVIVLWSSFYDNGGVPELLDSDPYILGYNVSNPVDVNNVVNTAHDSNFKVIAYSGGGGGWVYPSGHPMAGQHQDMAVTLQFRREFQQQYNVDGWYFDYAGAGDVMDDYSHIRQVRTDVGSNGIIYHHDSVDVWGVYTGLRAIMVNAYVNYTLTGETGSIAEVDEPNDPYFRFYTGGYGISQAYAAHKRLSTGRVSLSEKEKNRILGENLNGCERIRSLLWLSHFKAAYDVRKAEYLNDANVPFVPDVNWPIDGTTGWFRMPTDVNVIDINSSSATIIWTTNEDSNSEVSYTNNGIWWDCSLPGYPDGPNDVVCDPCMVTSHSITLTGLDSSIPYEFKIRSSDGNSVPDEIIWGYVGSFTTD